MLENNGFLFVQDFTGANIAPLQGHFYQSVPPGYKDTFLKKIIYDFTYGTNYGCMVDLSSTDNQPIIKRSPSGDLEIFNYLYDNHVSIVDMMKFLPQMHINKLIQMKTNHFKNITFVLFRQMKLQLLDQNNPPVNQCDEYTFTFANLNCYKEYMDYYTDPSDLEKRRQFSLKLHDQIRQNCEKLLSEMGVNINNEEILSALNQLETLDDRTVYNWLPHCIFLITQFLQSNKL